MFITILLDLWCSQIFKDPCDGNTLFFSIFLIYILQRFRLAKPLLVPKTPLQSRLCDQVCQGL